MSAIERRTFVHGSVPVEREISRSGERVLRGATALEVGWVQGERSLPASVGPAIRSDSAVKARCRNRATSWGCNGGAAPLAKMVWYYHTHLAIRVAGRF